MNRSFERRPLLKTTAVGTGLALGTGAASGVSGDEVTGDQSALTTFTATVPEWFITLDADDPSASTLDFLSANASGAFEITGEIYDDKTWQSTSVQIPEASAALENFDAASVIEGFNIPAILDTLTLDGLAELIVSLVEAADLDQSQIDAIAGLADSIVSLFDANPNFDDGLDNFLASPDKATVKSVIDIAGFAFGTQIDTIDDLLTVLGFDSPQEIEDILSDFSIADAALLNPLDVDVTVPDVSGMYDPNGVVTFTPSQVDIAVSFGGSTLFDFTVNTTDPSPTNLALTTGQSGATAGSVTGIVSDTPTLTAVDNEFILGLDQISFNAWIGGQDLAGAVADIGRGIINALGIDPQNFTADNLINALLTALNDIGLDRLLSDTNLGQRGFDLITALNFDVTGVTLQDIIDAIAIEQTLSDIDIPAILVAFDIDGLLNNTALLRDTPGRHAIQAGRDGNQVDLTINDSSALDAIVDVPPVIDGNDPPRDGDGDGLLERVRGESTACSIADVQALFDNLDNPDIQNNAEKFNFQGDIPNEVTIFDVQALYFQIPNC